MKSGIAPDCTGVMESNPIVVRVSSLPIQYKENVDQQQHAMDRG